MTEKQETPEKKVEEPDFDPQELMKRIQFKPAALVWHNFAEKHPDPDRWVLLWCNLGRIAQNFFVSFRDASGNYELPHPTKQYPARAWAYIELPAVDEEHMEKLKEVLREEYKAKPRQVKPIPNNGNQPPLKK